MPGPPCPAGRYSVVVLVTGFLLVVMVLSRLEGIPEGIVGQTVINAESGATITEGFTEQSTLPEDEEFRTEAKEIMTERSIYQATHSEDIFDEQFSQTTPTSEKEIDEQSSQTTPTSEEGIDEYSSQTVSTSPPQKSVKKHTTEPMSVKNHTTEPTPPSTEFDQNTTSSKTSLEPKSKNPKKGITTEHPTTSNKRTSQDVTVNTASPSTAPQARTSTEEYTYPPTVDSGPVDCLRLFQDDESTINSTILYQDQHPITITPDVKYTTLAANCSEFRRDRGYVLHPVSAEEADFKLSFTIMMYHRVEQFERLLRAIYRPQNYYCVHVDDTADDNVKAAVDAIVGCFDNVHRSSRSVAVTWATMSVLEAELVCMEDLLTIASDWKYHMNLAAEEFPLKTNLQIVQILKRFNGSNLMEGSAYKLDKYKARFRNNWDREGKTRLDRKPPPPHNIKMNKGSFLVVVTREFVDYVIHDKVPRDFLTWLEGAFIPDELYFPTLNFNPQLGVPGAYKGEGSTSASYPFLNRYVIWEGRPCRGVFVREVCILSVGDLWQLYDTPELFVNKFHLDYHPMAYTCMEQLIYNRTRAEILGLPGTHSAFDSAYYSQFDFTWNHT